MGVNSFAYQAILEPLKVHILESWLSALSIYLLSDVVGFDGLVFLLINFYHLFYGL